MRPSTHSPLVLLKPGPLVDVAVVIIPQGYKEKSAHSDCRHLSSIYYLLLHASEERLLKLVLSN